MLKRNSLYGLLDQGLSSLSNLLVALAFARSLSVVDFGTIALVLVGFGAILGTLRGVLGVQIARTVGPEAQARETRFALTAALLAGLLTALALVAATICWDLHPAVMIIGAAAAFALPQDVLRWFAVARGRALMACYSDGFWVVASVVGVLLSTRPGLADVVAIAWGAGAVGAFVILSLLLNVRPRTRGLSTWIRASLSTRSYFGLEGLLSSWIGFTCLAIAAALIGAAGSAALRGAGVLLGPLALVLSALPLLGIPALVQRGDLQDGKQVWRRIRFPCLGLAVCGAAIGALALAVPDTLGQELLGPSWAGAQKIVLVTGVEYAGLAILHGAVMGLKALGEARVVFCLRLCYGAISVAAVAAAGAVHRDALSVSIALGGSALMFAVVGVYTLRRTTVEKITSKVGMT